MTDARSPVFAIDGKAGLLARLAEDPRRATPRLARELWEQVAALHRSDARAARELAECAWIVAERAGDLESRALGHRALALAAIAAGRQRDALREYEAAERLHRELGEEVERARVLRSMIDPLMHLGRYAEALAAGAEAEGILRSRGEVILAAQVEANLGNVHHRLGRDAESLDAYDRALAAFRAAGDLDAAAVVEFNRANVFAARGELAEAERAFRAALRHYRSHGERLRATQCRYQLAYLAFLAGRYSEALRGLEAVRRAVAEIGDERHAALARLDEAELLLALSAWEEARDRAGEARDALARLGLVQDARLASLFLGLAALHGRRWRESAERLSEAAAGFREEGNEVLEALAVLYAAELALRRGDARAALRPAIRAVRSFASRGLAGKEAYARLVAASAGWALGRRSVAERQARRAIERVAALPSSEVRWRAHALLAETATLPEERHRQLVAAIAEAEAQRSEIVPDELQAAFDRDTVALHGRLARSLLERGAVREAFEAVESGRARVLVERISGTGGHAGAGPAPDRGLRASVQALNLLYRRLNEVERGAGSRAAAEPVRREIARREADLAARRRSLELTRATSAPSSPASSFESLLGILGPSETLVYYVFLHAELHAFVVDHRGIRWSGPIASRGDVEAALEGWLFQSRKTELGAGYLAERAAVLRASANQGLERLHALLWTPLEREVGDPEALLVVPSGSLVYVPFHALRADGVHLVERFEIATAPSARAATAWARSGAESRGSRDVVIGYEVPGLPGIAREVDAVSRRLPGATVLTGGAATAAALRDLARDARILHLAAHAEFRDDNPLLSSIQLADGRVTFYDLFDLRLRAELVVLSGCQTGWSRVLGGDELMGLARGFQYAGARALVSSLWPVGDAAAADWMTSFYGSLGRGTGPRAALTDAMREGIRAGRLPQEWAPFYLSGRT